MACKRSLFFAEGRGRLEDLEELLLLAPSKLGHQGIPLVEQPITCLLFEIHARVWEITKNNLVMGFVLSNTMKLHMTT